MVSCLSQLVQSGGAGVQCPVSAVAGVNSDHLVKPASARFLCSKATDFSVIRTSGEAALRSCRCLITSQTPSYMTLVLMDAVSCDPYEAVLKIVSVCVIFLLFRLP